MPEQLALIPYPHEIKERWVDSLSGQDDYMYLYCDCGWRTRGIWDRREIPAALRYAERHIKGEL